MKYLVGVCMVLISITSLASQISGREIYEQACATCHAPKVASALKAPAAFDQKAWKKRYKHAQAMAKAHPKKFPTADDYLARQVEIGKGLMHHGGLCIEAKLPKEYCQKQGIITAIKYMMKKPIQH